MRILLEILLKGLLGAILVSLVALLPQILLYTITEREKDMVHVNLSDVSTEFEVLPEGVYDATLMDAELVERDDPEKFPYIKWEFKLNDKPGKAWTNTSLSPNALWKLHELMVAVGEDPDIYEDEGGFDLDPEDYIGSEVSLHLTVGSYRGKAKNDVEAVLPLGGEVEEEEEVEEPPKKAGKKKAGGKRAAGKKRRRVV